jgi:hypothetical protein
VWLLCGVAFYMRSPNLTGIGLMIHSDFFGVARFTPSTSTVVVSSYEGAMIDSSSSSSSPAS